MVFIVAVAVVLIFVLWGVFFPESLSTTSTQLLNITTEKFGWFYLLATFSFLVFSIYLAFSKFGNIKLGADADEPDYSKGS